VRLAPNRAISLCFATPGHVRYTVHLDAPTPTGQFTVQGVVHIEQGGQKRQLQSALMQAVLQMFRSSLGSRSCPSQAPELVVLGSGCIDLSPISRCRIASIGHRPILSPQHRIARRNVVRDNSGIDSMFVGAGIRF
jgi:hypothetical protein